jgi:GT2 family glycosyltransferase
MVEARFPEVTLLQLAVNAGSAARTLGVRRSATRYVAFADDDSWWDAGALVRAADALDRHPRLAVVAARILVGEDSVVDPVCASMANSPLPGAGLPGPAVLGFLACGAVVRRDAFLGAGGFHPRLEIGGEEELLALDLAAAGWQLSYLDSVVARHHPVAGPERVGRERTVVRNQLWVAWLRRPVRVAVLRSLRHLRRCDLRLAASVLGSAAAGLPWVIAERRRLPASVERAVAALERPYSPARRSR